MRRGDKVHMVGIGGYGMGPLARILLDMGLEVSGSDMKPSVRTDRLAGLGADVHIGHAASNVPDGLFAVVVSAAIPSDNPELERARARSTPILTHAQMVGRLLDERFGIGVSGAHGKTTTTAMVSLVLDRNGMDPTVLIGGEVDEFSGGGRLGAGEYFVVEADEAYGRFLEMRPRIAVVTNMDDDHLDHYGTIENVEKAFRQFLLSLPEGATAILGADCERAATLEGVCPGGTVTFGLTPRADVTAERVERLEFGSRFLVRRKGEPLGTMELSVPGEHNVRNALAAVCVGLALGLRFDQISSALASFRGVHRRFEFHGMPRNVMVVDDYAHHPTEIRAALRAAKQGWERRLVAVFQPQRFTRTQLLMEEFAAAFDDADIALVTDIYYEGTGETPIPGVSSATLVEKVRSRWRALGKEGEAIHVPSPAAATDYLLSICRTGDLIITMGAGNISGVAEDLAAELSGAGERRSGTSSEVCDT